MLERSISLALCLSLSASLSLFPLLPSQYPPISSRCYPLLATSTFRHPFPEGSMEEHLPPGLLEACVVVGASSEKLKEVYQVRNACSLPITHRIIFRMLSIQYILIWGRAGIVRNTHVHIHSCCVLRLLYNNSNKYRKICRPVHIVIVLYRAPINVQLVFKARQIMNSGGVLFCSEAS